MKKNTEYIIPYEGLKDGRHEFTFEIDDKFFEPFNTEHVFRDINVNMQVSLMKDLTMLVFDFELEGKAKVNCDRCLADIPQVVKASNKLIVKFGDDVEDDNETIVTLPQAEYEIDLAPYIYDYICLSFPLKMDCSNLKESEKPCDEEVLKKISNLQINKENEKQGDPRWDVLKKLK